MTGAGRTSSRVAAAAVLALAVVGCGAREDASPPPTPDGDASAPAADEPREDRRPTAPGPDDEAAPTPEPTPEPAPTPEPQQAPEPDATEVAVPDPIAAIFTLPPQVQVDQAGTSDGDGTTAVVQLTGEFVGGDLAAAATAFTAALDDAGVAAVQEPSADGVAFVAPLERATLAIALLADDGRTFVSVDLLVDRTA